MMGQIRYILLGATFLATLALPQWTRASDTRSAPGTIILAQANPNDPKEKAKAKQQQQQQQQQQKGPQATTPQSRGTPQVPQGQPRVVGTPPANQPVTGTPPAGRPGFRTVPPGNQQGIGQQNTPPQGPQGQPKIVGTPPANQPATGTPPQGRPGFRTVPPGNQQGIGQQNTPPQGPQGQPQGQQFGRQSPSNAPAPLLKGQPQGQPQGQQFGRQSPANAPAPGPKGQPQGQQFGRQVPGPAPVARFGNVDQLRSLRQERVEGNRRVFVEPGNRSIVREGNRTFVRHDEGERFRRWDANARRERRGVESFTFFRRPGGYEIIDVTDANGRLLRRIRRDADGREVVLIDNRLRGGRAGFFLALGAPVITIPRDRYIVDVGGAPPSLLYDTLEAEPVVPIERAYSLDEVRYNAPLRDRLSRIDINTINFETGSWELAPEQADQLAEVAQVILRILERGPNEIFLIEGHTDFVGNEVDNLSLSDRRAESVASVLTENFQIPPENLTTQGYGAQFLKVPTQGPSRENRRVTIRRITPLLTGAVR
jgi:outer membrane protein OmpA-like peptidoglycan-associated protein